MKTRMLGLSGIDVSEYTLGTMTFGVQTPESDAFMQMDMALDHGINAFDTAELYPVLPISRKTQGESERIIGRYIRERQNRDRLKIFTKIVGIGNHTAKDGEPINKVELIKSLDRSLQNLQTDYVDLYQLHWPNRGSYHFRKLWNYEVGGGATSAIEDDLLETLETLTQLQKDGKIRAFGTSNESAWGIMKFLELSKNHDLIRISATQNEYSLMHRIYEPDLSEIGVRENVGLLTYTSLAGGILTGKYGPRGELVPQGSRRSIEANVGGRVTETGKIWEVAQAYIDLAQAHNMSPISMAYRFCLSKNFVSSVIIGATNTNQLAQILDGNYAPLPSEMLKDIDAIRRLYPIPM